MCHLPFDISFGMTQLLSGNVRSGRFLPHIASHPTSPRDGIWVVTDLQRPMAL